MATNLNITGNVTLLKNNAVSSTGVAIAPVDLEYGQIAINYNAKDPCIFIKVLGDNGATSIQKFVGEAVIAKTLSDILGESAADLATLKDLIKQFEGSNNDVLTLVKNIDAAVKLKADTTALNAHKNSTSNPHSVTKAQVGLANVNNTSDAAKPISTATQTALNGKLGKTETAADSSKLGGKAAADYWHKANSNLKTVDWNAKNLISGSFTDTDFMCIEQRRGGYSARINSSGGKAYFTNIKEDGTQEGVLEVLAGSLKFGTTTSDVKTVWHAGNSNLSTIDWACNTLDAATQIRVTNPSNTKANCTLGWLNNKARIRVGGEGDGSENAFEIQGTSNIVFASFNRTQSYVNGSFGIGTGTPSTKLHIHGDVFSGGNDSGYWFGPLATPRTNIKAEWTDDNNVGYVFNNMINSVNKEAMRLFNGRLGINTTSPSELLDVGGNGVFRGNLVVKGEAVTYSQDGVEARTVAAASATRLADLEDVDLTGASDNFVLYRSNTTNANGDRVWKARSDAKSWSEISGKPTTFTPVDHNHIGGTYTTTTPSDRGLKQDICTLDNSLNTILSINPVRYNWTSEAMDRFHFKHHSSIGVIAQELEDIIPTAVMQMDEQYKAVDYVQIVPYLVGAVKQLNNELANKNIAIENARKDYKRAYGESVNLKKEMDALKLEVDEMKSLIKQNLI